MQPRFNHPLKNDPVLTEMVQTEKTYNSAMHMLERALQETLSTERSSLLKSVCQQLNYLNDISDKLLENVTKALHADITPQEETALRASREQLLKAFFHAYQSMAELYHQYLADVKSDPKQFNTVDQFLQKHSPSQLNFEAHLIMPIQRGPRYSMLVKEIIKRMQRLGNLDTSEFEKLSALFDNSLASINQKLPARSTEANQANKPYVFGDYTRWACAATYSSLFGESNEKSAAEEGQTHRSYQFGDYTRWAYSTFFSESNAATGTMEKATQDANHSPRTPT